MNQLWDTYSDIERVELPVWAAIHVSVHFKLGDVEQRAVVESVGPLHIQNGLTECTGSSVP